MDKDRSSTDSEPGKNIKTKSSADFVTPSIILFIDGLVVSVGGWLYWFVISKLTLASEIGIAVMVYSLVTLITTLTQLGFEYPLLKKAHISGSSVLGTSLAIELVITLASIPIVFIVINALYDDSIEQFTWITIALLILLSVDFVLRFALLGISNSKIVLVIDLAGVAIKLSTGFVLVSLSYGAFGILIAYLFEGLVITFSSLYFIKKSFSLRIGNVKYIKETIKDALVNTPAKWSKVLIITLSIVLLGLLNISNSDVGIYYVVLMITIVVANFASSMAYMVIPTSFALNTDLSSSSLRIGLSLTAPLVVALLVVPRSILSLIGPEYESAQAVLLVLALGILPSSITANMISKLNFLGRSRTLILTGTVQISIFFLCFFVLVPTYEIMGAAISILVAYLSSSLLLIILTDRRSFRYVAYACLSVLAGFIVGQMTSLIVGYEQQFLIVIFSIVVSIIVIFTTKNMTVTETKFLLQAMLQKK